MLPLSLSLSREQGPTITILLPPVVWRRWWRWVFLFLFVFHFKFFSAFFLQLNCNLVGHTSHPTLSLSREKGPTITIPVPPAAWRRCWWRVFLFCYFFISNFSQHLFTVKLLFNWPCRPPSLSLSRQQEHATTIHMLLVTWGRQWRWVFLLFLFFPHCTFFFSQLFFQFNCSQF